jgi:NTP pyrophosphatase (non-canonical NTP hydrolase)
MSQTKEVLVEVKDKKPTVVPGPVLLADGMPNHDDVVRLLAKSGIAIVETFDEAKADILHMAVGLVTEARELVIACFANDKVNAKEEIGDYAFYLAGLRQALARHYDDEDPLVTVTAGYDIAGFLLQTMHIQEHVKKYYAYNKDLDVKSLYVILTELESMLLAIANNLGIAVSEAIDANREKLWKKRYPNGYTDQAAIDRADKAGE